MLRVTFCAYEKPDNVGGPVSWLRRLVPLLRQRGIEVRCLFIMHYGETGPALSSLLADGVPCTWTSAETTEDRVRWILDQLNRNPPDIFVPNLVVAAYFAARWARAAGIRTVGILHSDDNFYRGIADEFVLGDQSSSVDAVVCVSRELEQSVTASRPAIALVRRIPYGIDVPRTAVERTERALRLGYVGRLAEEQKRISDVVRAMCRAAREVPGTTAVLYGDGPDRPAVEQLLAGECSDCNVTLGGLIDGERIQERLRNIDVIVLLSDYEGLPIALLEAMATGCVPVCLRGKSGIPELVEDEVTGLLVNDRSDGFIAAVRRLKDDPALWSALSYGARKRASQFSAEASADLWVSLFNELVPEARHPQRVTISNRLHLPPVNPDIASADIRAVVPSLSTRIYRKTRMTLGRIKAVILG